MRRLLGESHDPWSTRTAREPAAEAALDVQLPAVAMATATAAMLKHCVNCTRAGESSKTWSSREQSRHGKFWVCRMHTRCRESTHEAAATRRQRYFAAAVRIDGVRCSSIRFGRCGAGASLDDRTLLRRPNQNTDRGAARCRPNSRRHRAPDSPRLAGGDSRLRRRQRDGIVVA